MNTTQIRPEFAAIGDRAEAAIGEMVERLRLGQRFIIATGGGMNSLLSAVLALEAIRRAGAGQVQHTIFCQPTITPGPEMNDHQERMLDEMARFCAIHALQVNIVRAAADAVAGAGDVRIVGIRHDESRHRRAAIAASGDYSPVADWSLEDILDFIDMCSSDAAAMPVAVAASTFGRMQDMIKSAGNTPCRLH